MLLCCYREKQLKSIKLEASCLLHSSAKQYLNAADLFNLFQPPEQFFILNKTNKHFCCPFLL